jgi:hypothetical protein
LWGRSALYSVFWIRGRTKGLIIFMFLASGCVCHTVVAVY